MTTPLLTLLDLAKQRNSAGSAYVEILDETFKMTPEVSGMVYDPNTGNYRKVPNVGAVRPIPGRTYEAKVWNNLPTVPFRNFNEGVDFSKGDGVSRTFQTRLINPKWGADNAMSFEQDFASRMTDEAMLQTNSAKQTLGNQFYYGAVADTNKGFPGLISFYDDTNFSVDATGTLVKTSVWFVKFGFGGVEWLYGNNLAGITPQPPRLGDYTDGNGKTFTAMIQESYLFPGVKVSSPWGVVRIKNIGTANGKKLTWAHMREAWFKMANKGVVPDAIFMSPRSQAQLQDANVTTENPNPTLPTQFNGVPICPSNSISDAETV